MLREFIKKIVDGQDLTMDESSAAMECIMDGGAGDVQVAAFLTAMRMKGETVDEITGAAVVMRGKATAIPVSDRVNLVDIVGTGGDLSGTFNISTAAVFAACGAGLRIAKHGNRSVSSRCGSADVMETLGVNIEMTAEDTARCIEEIGIGFLFAQRLHRAMKHAAVARKEIGIRTVFNILGPLTNPADAGIQLVGVYDRKLVQTFAGVLQKLGKKRAMVVHGSDGLDEISVSDITMACELRGGRLHSYTIDPRDYGFVLAGNEALYGDDAETNARIILDVLGGKPGPQRDIVCLNAGAAIMVSGKAETLQDGIAQAAEAIDDGKALQKLYDLITLTGELKKR